MTAPCRNCARRTVTPNCHGTCERYLAYDAERRELRRAKSIEYEAAAPMVQHILDRKNKWRKANKTMR